MTAIKLYISDVNKNKPYFFIYSFTRVALCMLVLHYTVELVFHLSRLLYFADKQELANTG